MNFTDCGVYQKALRTDRQGGVLAEAEERTGQAMVLHWLLEIFEI